MGKHDRMILQFVQYIAEQACEIIDSSSDKNTKAWSPSDTVLSEKNMQQNDFMQMLTNFNWTAAELFNWFKSKNNKIDLAWSKTFTSVQCRIEVKQWHLFIYLYYYYYNNEANDMSLRPTSLLNRWEEFTGF